MRKPKTSDPKPGRPAGATTEPTAPAVSYPARCPHCGSTDREPYSRGIAAEQPADRDPMGNPCTHVVWRRTRCLACGQILMVRTYEHRGARPR